MKHNRKHTHKKPKEMRHQATDVWTSLLQDAVELALVKGKAKQLSEGY